MLICDLTENLCGFVTVEFCEIQETKFSLIFRSITMKSLKLSFKVVALALMACVSGFATAADSTGLAVTANVPGLCKFSTAPTSLAFGAVDPSLTADKVVLANVNYKCTKNTTSLGVTADKLGLARTMVSILNPADTMNYTLAFAGGTQIGKGFGPGQDLVLAVTGTITAAQYQNAAAGAYSESVTLTITN